MDHPTPRQLWMSVLARSSTATIVDLLAACPKLPPHTVLRGPEAGLVMVRGRAGSAGQKFNLGEMTVTRCTVRAGADGAERIGHAYVAGREAGRAELAARLDAALQDPALHDTIHAEVIRPLAAAQADARAATARRAAATQVQFFTMATMRT